MVCNFVIVTSYGFINGMITWFGFSLCGVPILKYKFMCWWCSKFTKNFLRGMWLCAIWFMQSKLLVVNLSCAQTLPYLKISSIYAYLLLICSVLRYYVLHYHVFILFQSGPVYYSTLSTVISSYICHTTVSSILNINLDIGFWTIISLHFVC